MSSVSSITCLAHPTQSTGYAILTRLMAMTANEKKPTRQSKWLSGRLL